MTAVAPALPADLEAGLRRLKLASIRRLAPEVCRTAKTQRWTPEELLRTLVEAEIAAHDESNLRARLKQAGFPVQKTLAEFNVQLSSVPQKTFDYLASLEWLASHANPCLLGPAGTGKSHCESHSAGSGRHDPKVALAPDGPGHDSKESLAPGLGAGCPRIGYVCLSAAGASLAHRSLA